jgi:ABC-type Mn2+/Zn2+ transport system permease subunit
MASHEILITIIEDFPLALFGSMLVGTLCAFLGVYVVAKRIVFFGAVLTQVSVLGLAISFLPFIATSHTLTSLLLTLAFALVVSRMLTGKRFPQDAVLGIVFVTAIALRILILQVTPTVEVAEIEHLLRGDILFVAPELFFPMLAVFLLVMGLHLLFFKEFQYISFDAETARTQGFHAGFWEMLFYGTTGAVIALATHMVGDIFVFGFLVVPPFAAMLLARRVRRIFLLAVLIGAAAPAVGLFLAFLLDLPSSPASIAVASIVLITAWLIHIIRHR